MRRIALGLLFAGLLSLGVGCQRKIDLEDLKKEQAKAERKEKPAAAREDDRRHDALVAGKDEDGDKAMEARAYLAPGQTKNGLWKTSRDQTLKWTEELYEAGAAKVYAVYMPADKTIQINMCASLLVELPKHAEQRASVFKAFNRIDKQLWGEDHEKISDAGQKFVFLNMDP